jgi:hypothetical protein
MWMASLAPLLRLRFCLHQQHAGILRKIGATLVALAAMHLLMFACGTSEPQRMMTLHAKFDRLQVFVAAFPTLHAAIIRISWGVKMALCLEGYQTWRAVWTTSFNLAHCSSSVSRFPSMVEANPHCGLSARFSSGT